tara:strand:- start:16351 stop:16980 length:630 start_codon:yes stop_codon:yes gene_type:complete
MLVVFMMNAKKINIDLTSPFQTTCPHYKAMTSLKFAEGYREEMKSSESFGLINGCFDPLHVGHIWLLNQAREACDVLWVALNSDDYIRKNKSKPGGIAFIPQMGRVYSLLSLEAVTGVTVYNQQNCADVIKALKPDLLLKSKEYEKAKSYGSTTFTTPESYKHIVNTEDELRAATDVGADVKYLDMLPGYSSTILLEKLLGIDKLDDII